MRTTSNWRQIVKMDDVSICTIFSGLNTLPILKKVLQLYKMLLPTFPTKCPFLPKVYEFKNVSIISPEMLKLWEEVFAPVSFSTMKYPPNGLYR